MSATSTFIQIAWKNTWRNKRRTILTLCAIVFGSWLMVAGIGMGEGFHNAWIRNALKVHTGHINITAPGFRENISADRYISDINQVLSAIKDDTRIKAYTVRVKALGLAYTSHGNTRVIINGVLPSLELSMTNLTRCILEGKFFSDDHTNRIVLGEKVAKNLEVGLGDKVIIRTMSLQGEISGGAYRVSAILRTGMPTFDSTFIYIPLSEAQHLLGYEQNQANEIALWVPKRGDVGNVRDDLRRTLSGTGLSVEGWKEVFPELWQWVQMDDAFLYITVLVLVVIIAFGILNTLLMSIFERIREFGIMTALGTRPGYLILTIITEGIFLGLIGLILGIPLGTLTNWILSIKGIDLSAYSELLETFGAVDPILYSEINFFSIWYPTVVVFLTVLLVSLYPAIYAARLRPTEALRFH